MKSIKMNRRAVLRGIGGVALALPILEGLLPRRARAQTIDQRYAIFFRQANGCAQANPNDGEPERFWPRTFGALTEASMADRAVGELTAYRDKLLVLQNVNMEYFDFGDGHAQGALQALTARPPLVSGAGGDSEAGGESIDHRIGRELNPAGRESLVMFAGQTGGWLNGPCISHRGAGQRRSAFNDPYNGYETLVGAETGLSDEANELLINRSKSVNDLVREQLQALKNSPALSTADRQRLDLHLEGIRDLELQLNARFTPEEEAALEAASPGFDSTNGDETLETARLHMDVAALAVSAGLTKAVSIQVGVGNDGNTRYRNLDTGDLMENYHFISHRRLSHGSDGAVIPDAHGLHHQVDRHFAQTFRHLLDRLAAVTSANGATLLDEGVSVWFNDNASGPPHAIDNIPWILAGSCNGFLVQGQMIDVLNGQNARTHNRLLNTIGSAVGLRKENGDLLDDFGDDSLPTGVLDQLIA